MDTTLSQILPDMARTPGIPLLVPRDDPQLNPSPIARLFAEKGEVGAEHVIGAAMDELSERLVKVEALHAASRFGELARLSRSMVGVADGIGFRGVAHAAAQVSDCALTRDPTALAATVARLSRLVEQSLAAVWDLDPGGPADPGVSG